MILKYSSLSLKSPSIVCLRNGEDGEGIFLNVKPFKQIARHIYVNLYISFLFKGWEII